MSIELCCVCDEPTGHAGEGDDSLFCGQCGAGPFCVECLAGHGCFVGDTRTPDEVEADRGDEKYHQLKDEGRLGEGGRRLGE